MKAPFSKANRWSWDLRWIQRGCYSINNKITLRERDFNDSNVTSGQALCRTMKLKTILLASINCITKCDLLSNMIARFLSCVLRCIEPFPVHIVHKMAHFMPSLSFYFSAKNCRTMWPSGFCPQARPFVAVMTFW